jgi:DNA repair photolyase
MSIKISGTKEWSTDSYNCVIGCSHNCKYCFARYNAVNRFKYVTDWTKEKINWTKVNKKHTKYKGVVMFPTTHDITPHTLEACIVAISNILDANNDILIVSKPHAECIEKICSVFKDRKKQILFRFTIGAMREDVLKFWEANAPTYVERLYCLQHAFKCGFKTSVSMEPILDYASLHLLINSFKAYVTDAIWLGKMNNIDKRVKINNGDDYLIVNQLKSLQSDVHIKEIYNKYKDDKKIKWKESIKEVVGLKLAEKAGADE